MMDIPLRFLYQFSLAGRSGVGHPRTPQRHAGTSRILGCGRAAVELGATSRPPGAPTGDGTRLLKPSEAEAPRWSASDSLLVQRRRLGSDLRHRCPWAKAEVRRFGWPQARLHPSIHPSGASQLSLVTVSSASTDSGGLSKRPKPVLRYSQTDKRRHRRCNGDRKS
jgi:hypothetical protein